MNSERKGKLHVLKGYKRSKRLPDLNIPPSDNREMAETSSQAEAAGLGDVGVSRRPELPEMIDVEAIDDDVIVSSPRSFAEAKNNAERNRGRTVLVDLDLERSSSLQNNKRRRAPSQTIVNCDVYINLDGTSSSGSLREIIQPFPLPSPPRKEPTFNCPICMGSLVEETSTKCGHIFCKKCIKSALAVQSKCPTCRKKVVAKDLIRVFLPATG